MGIHLRRSLHFTQDQHSQTAPDWALVGAARAYRMSRENPEWEGGAACYCSLLLSRCVLYYNCTAGCARSGFYERLGSRGAAVAVLLYTEHFTLGV